MSNRSNDFSDYSRFSLDIERGDEDEESPHPLSNRRRPGSRATSSRASSGTSSRYRSNYNTLPVNNAGAIQIIQDGFDDEEEWFVEDVSDDGHDLESMNSASPADQYPSTAEAEQYPYTGGAEPTGYGQTYQTFSQRYASQQLTAYQPGGDDSQLSGSEVNGQQQLVLRDPRAVVEVDTDEENEIVNRIKSEITSQLKAEVKDEIKHLTNGSNAEEQEDESIDPRVKEALLQMRKFDRILEKRTKRERRIKRERIALQKKLKAELYELNNERPSGCKSTKDETLNTERFLSLPPSIARFDREVAEHSEDDDDWSGAPVFATEPPSYDTASSKSGRSNRTGKAGRSDGSSSAAGSQSTNKSGNTTDRSKRRRKPKIGPDGKPVDKDFIQRNIDLAADAGNTVAMTDDEKNRLADILEDLDELEEALPEEQGAPMYSVAVKPGEGFALDNSNRVAMNEIDKKLEGLLGREEYNSIMTAPSHLTFDSLQLFSRTHDSQNTDITEIGERALQETREHRDQQRRLTDIERELADLTTAVQSEIESPNLSDQQLHVLLDQCNRIVSRATIETDSLSQSTSPRSAQSTARESAMSSHPQLEESVLKALLDQARSEGIISRTEQEPQPDEDSEFITENQRENLLLNPRSTSRLTVNGTL